MGRQVFTAGEILTAANMNDLSDQTVMVFDDATARTTAIPTPVEGMVTYLKDTDSVDKFDGSAFVPVGIAPAILQVVSSRKTGIQVVSSSTYQIATDLSVSITPSSASNKVFVMVDCAVQASENAVQGVMVSIFKDGIQLLDPSSPGSRTPTLFFANAHPLTNRGAGLDRVSGTFFDEPATTSSITYDVRVRATSEPVFINRSLGDADNSTNPRSVSTITVLEVAG